MKLFLWQRLNHMTNEWHHEGGAVVIAKDQARAEELLPSGKPNCRCNDCRTEPSRCVRNAQVRLVLTVSSRTKEQIIIFPDKGCC